MIDYWVEFNDLMGWNRAACCPTYDDAASYARGLALPDGEVRIVRVQYLKNASPQARVLPVLRVFHGGKK